MREQRILGIRKTTLVKKENYNQKLAKGKPKFNFLRADFKEGAILIQNDDAFGLFYACEYSRLNKQNYKPHQFYQLMCSAQKNKELVSQLLTEITVSPDLDSYPPEIYLQKVQDAYDKNFPHQYKIFIFDETKKAIHKTGSITNRHALTLFYDSKNTQYNVIRSMRYFFKYSRYYCFSCESFYSDAIKHTNMCLQKCHMCYGILESYSLFYVFYITS